MGWTDGAQAEASTRKGFIGRLLSHSGTRYLIAGGIAFLVDFGLLALFRDVVGWPVWLATGAAFLISFAFTYTIQRVFSFGSRAPHGTALAKYTALVAFNTLATVAIVSGVSALGFGWVIGKVLATVASTIWNYFAYRHWVFAHDADDPSPRKDT